MPSTSEIFATIGKVGVILSFSIRYIDPNEISASLANASWDKPAFSLAALIFAPSDFFDISKSIDLIWSVMNSIMRLYL